MEPGNITGRTAQENGPEIIVATMDTPWFSEIMPEAVLPALEKIRDAQGVGRWEAYLHQISDNSFCIIGADRRGTVFGIYDLSEQIGVSPWYFWADVPVRKRTAYAFST